MQLQASRYQNEIDRLMQDTAQAAADSAMRMSLLSGITSQVISSLEQKQEESILEVSSLREQVADMHLSIRELTRELDEVKEDAKLPCPSKFKVGTLLPELLKTLDTKTDYTKQFSLTGVHLGEGGFSKVVELTQVATGRLCAAKKLDVRKQARTYMEVFATIHLRHDNIVEALGVFQTNRNEVTVVMPRLVMSLDKLVDERPLAHEFTAFVVSQVACALKYIHGMEMVHKDVKPANILIGFDGAVQLADFGLVEVVYKGSSLYDTNGTGGFMAPEQIRGVGHDQLSDIWSLGVSAFHCLNGSNYVDVEECVVQLLIDGVRGVPANYGTPEISEFFDGVLEMNPKERWSAADVMECDFITAVSSGVQDEFLAYILTVV
ncbi:kinase-like domain-containing protein [Obelidium mucronatum]|nr:kinase-like domain-containing protein [Obelidium mucronatum]